VLVRRAPKSPDPLMTPRPLGAPGRFEVDATWGTVQPLVLAPGIRTIGELELIAHIEEGLALVDTRQARFFAGGSIPTARNIPHDEIGARIAELDPARPTAFFCNGPQCTATPSAIHTLLDAGYPPEAIHYYRGGMHDWLTLGFPLS
jgi:rhodanese-related sulfurtransferase